jgi:hypothetical protein
MTKINLIKTLFIMVVLAILSPRVIACTNVLVSAGASADGSVMTSWTYDVAGFAQPLHYYEGGEYP